MKMKMLLEARSKGDYDKVINDLKLALGHIFKAAPSFNKINKEAINIEDGEEYWHGNEDLLHSILSYTILQLKGVNQFATEVHIGDGRADLLYISKEFHTAVILELKYNQHEASSAIKQINDKSYARPVPHGFKVVKVGVNIDYDKTLHLEKEIIKALTDQVTEKFTDINVNIEPLDLIINDDITQNEQAEQIIIGDINDSDLT